jgi:ATP-dependent exoDNAse (exonuclease V) beta subunit
VKAVADELVEASAPVGDVLWVEVPRPEGKDRPGGDRFGALVHEVLATVPLDAVEADVRAMVESRAARLGAPAKDVEMALDLVVRVLDHEVMREARASADVRRELPLFDRSPDGRVREGVADLLYRVEEASGAAAWVVVDYKTDRDPASRRTSYEHQVALYAEMLTGITGEPARAVVLVV